MVFVRLDPHDARRLGGAKAERERRRERDRHLAEKLTDPTSADNTRNPFLERDGLQRPFENREQGAPVTRVHRVLAGHEPDVGSDARKAFALDRAKIRKDRDAGDLVRGHHASPSNPVTTSLIRRD